MPGTPTSTPRRRCASRPHPATACICTRCCPRRPGGAPVLLLRGARRQGARYRRALRQTLRGGDQALAKGLSKPRTQTSESTRTGAHVGSKRIIAQVLSLDTVRTTRYGRGFIAALRLDDDPSRRVLPAAPTKADGTKPVATYFTLSGCEAVLRSPANPTRSSPVYHHKPCAREGHPFESPVIAYPLVQVILNEPCDKAVLPVGRRSAEGQRASPPSNAPTARHWCARPPAPSTGSTKPCASTPPGTRKTVSIVAHEHGCSSTCRF